MAQVGSRSALPCWLAVLAVALMGCGSDPILAVHGLSDGGQSVDGGSADGAGVRDAAPTDGSTTSLDASCRQRVDGDPLRINEVMADNEGVSIDENLETEDWIELINTGDAPVDLGNYMITDAPDTAYTLPNLSIDPGATIVLWADNEPTQGILHLRFKLSSKGETVALLADPCTVVDEVTYPELPANESFARLPDGDGDFSVCRYATPDRENGERCEPPVPPELVDDMVFADYTWPDPHPAPEGPLVISEIALQPAAFVEVANIGSANVTLANFTLTLSDHAPGLAWPSVSDGVAIAWPSGTPSLAAGERVLVPVTSSDTAAIAARPEFEGVASIFQTGRVDAIERVDFMRWPSGTALTRVPDDTGRHVFCLLTSPGSENTLCQPIAERAVGDRVRHLRTPGDFAMLAEGGTAVGASSVKFVLDLQGGDVVHLLRSEDWALHYTFIRELIYGDPRLDRCDPIQAQEFLVGWQAFSVTEYFQTTGRRFLLGTLVHHGGSDLRTLEYTSGDAILPLDMQYAFRKTMEHVLDPTRWSLRPQSPAQVSYMRQIEGTVPIVGTNAPFVGVDYQPLTETVGYGVLRFVPTSELDTTPLGPDVIVVTDDVPNDIALVGGLITEAFQTPLAHVNVLAQNRDTPNMALRDARNHPDLVPLFDRVVRLEVTSGGFDVSLADPTEAAAFWDSRRPTGPPLAPRLDTTVRELRDLAARGLQDAPYMGTKAAQLAELERVSGNRVGCFDTTPLLLPDSSFSIPVVHSLEHYDASGARTRLAELEADADFVADPTARAAGLEEVRNLVLAHPVDPGLLADVTSEVQSRFASARVRFRSSSNAEDLPSFNGAGLYTSVSAEIGDPERRIDDAMRTVWASLYNQRAYDERTHSHVDQSAVAMGILVHPAFLSERARGVGVSRNVLDPIRGDIHYINAQIGEASVTNPAPGVVTEQIVYRWPPRTPRLEYRSRSSLAPEGMDVLTAVEADAIACVLGSIHDHFQPLLDPARENRLFAMEIEFKILPPDRTLLVKQARPHSFAAVDVPADCREL